MTQDLHDFVSYRLSRARETLEEARILAQNDHWNAVANRLYYACFYAVNALLVSNNLSFSSHNGVKNEFHKSFVKTGKIAIVLGKTYSRLFNLRQEGDYIDFKRFEKEEISPFINDAEEFIKEVEALINP